MSTSAQRPVVGIVVLTGLFALIVKVFSGFLEAPFVALFGHMWMSGVRHALVDCGVPASFVARYVSFLLIDVPTWCLLLVVAFCLGMNASRLAKIAACSFTVWLPVMGFVTALWFDCFYQDGFSEDVHRQVLYGFNTRVVPALVTFMVGWFGWGLGSLASGLMKLKLRGATANGNRSG